MDIKEHIEKGFKDYKNSDDSGGAIDGAAYTSITNCVANNSREGTIERGILRQGGWSVEAVDSRIGGPGAIPTRMNVTVKRRCLLWQRVVSVWTRVRRRVSIPAIPGSLAPVRKPSRSSVERQLLRRRARSRTMTPRANVPRDSLSAGVTP